MLLQRELLLAAVGCCGREGARRESEGRGLPGRRRVTRGTQGQRRRAGLRASGEGSRCTSKARLLHLEVRRGRKRDGEGRVVLHGRHSPSRRGVQLRLPVLGELAGGGGEVKLLARRQLEEARWQTRVAAATGVGVVPALPWGWERLSRERERCGVGHVCGGRRWELCGG